MLQISDIAETAVECVPVDPGAPKHALGGFDAAIWLAGPLAPLLLGAARRAGLAALVGPGVLAATPSRSPIPRAALRPVSEGAHVLARDEAEMRRAARLMPRAAAEMAGPLQSGGVPPACDRTVLARYASALAGRPAWFAAAAGEVDRGSLLEAHAALRRRVHRALLILERPGAGGPGAPPAASDAVLEGGADARGLFHRLAPVSVMADSFAPGGRADPLAAAALGSAVLWGGYPGTNAEAYDRLSAAGACLRAEGALADHVEAALAPDETARRARAGWEVVTEGAVATGRLADLAVDALDARGAI